MSDGVRNHTNSIIVVGDLQLGSIDAIQRDGEVAEVIVHESKQG